MLKRLFGRSHTPLPPPSSPDEPLSHPSIVTDATFATAIVSPTLTVVDFWADWCQPCQIMSAYVEMLARAYGERLRVLTLDVDENPGSAEEAQVMGLPTLIFYRDGVEVHRTTGVTSYEDLQRQIERLLS